MAVAALKPVGKFYGEIRALSDLAGRIGILIAGPAHPFERLEQPLQVLRQELLAKGRIVARPRKLILGDQVAHRLGL
jgi:hypothetical protein